MDVSLAALFDFYAFSTGRTLFALGQVLSAAKEIGKLNEIVDHTKEAIDHARETRALEAKYARSATEPKGNPKVAEIDVRLDRQLVSLRDLVQAQIDGAVDDADGDTAAEGRKVLGDLFPKGVTAITQAPWVEELALVDGLLDVAEKTHAAFLKGIGAGAIVKRIRKTNEEYRGALSKGPSAAIEAKDVRAARAKNQQYLCEVVALIVGKFPFSTKAHVDARTQLLGPILAQGEAIAAYIRARRSVEDVNPETGDLDPTGTTPAPKPDDPAPAKPEK